MAKGTIPLLAPSAAPVAAMGLTSDAALRRSAELGPNAVVEKGPLRWQALLAKRYEPRTREFVHLMGRRPANSIRARGMNIRRPKAGYMAAIFTFPPNPRDCFARPTNRALTRSTVGSDPLQTKRERDGAFWSDSQWVPARMRPTRNARPTPAVTAQTVPINNPSTVCMRVFRPSFSSSDQTRIPRRCRTLSC
jgi:hypothetical protein